MTPEVTKPVQSSPERGKRNDRTAVLEELRNLDVWARSAPIRLAGYEDDLSEPHILRGID